MVGTLREDVDEAEAEWERQLDSFGRDRDADDESVYDDEEQEDAHREDENDKTFTATDDDLTNSQQLPHISPSYSPSPPPPPSTSTDRHRHPTLDLTHTLHPTQEIDALRVVLPTPHSSFSASFGQRLSIQSNGSDGELGIGLSLLANLVVGEDTSRIIVGRT